jgi:hypothetical protein
MENLPKGKGQFLWLLDRLEGGDMVKLADRLAHEGYRWVCVKMQDGILHFAGYKPYRQQELLALLVPELERVGIELHGWGFIYGQSPYTGRSLVSQEIAITLEVIERWQPVSWHINAEYAYKHSGAASHADAYCKAIKQAHPELAMGLSSYKFPKQHPELPFWAFAPHLDFWAPQVYWQKAYNPIEQLSRSIDEYKAIRELPFVCAGTLYPEGTWWPTAQQVLDFSESCKARPEVVAVYYWEYHYLIYRPANRAALITFEWEQSELPPEPPEQGNCLELVRVAMPLLQASARKIEQASELLLAGAENLSQAIEIIEEI